MTSGQLMTLAFATEPKKELNGSVSLHKNNIVSKKTCILHNFVLWKKAYFFLSCLTSTHRIFKFSWNHLVKLFNNFIMKPKHISLFLATSILLNCLLILNIRSRKFDRRIIPMKCLFLWPSPYGSTFLGSPRSSDAGTLVFLSCLWIRIISIRFVWSSRCDKELIWPQAKEYVSIIV